MTKAPRSYRRLRVYTFDPSLATKLDTALINQTVLDVPWEDDLEPGPVGHYLAVVDVDPASDCCYEPVDLDERHLLAQDGVAPSEGDPQFHQQMVYAVCMITIANFERALGRRILWGPHIERDEKTREVTGTEPVFQLRVYPHALREANAYYSPEKKALLFGYFPTSLLDSDEGLPEGLVFTCLSQDVVTHETTHALLDGLHRYFAEPSNPDVFGFHEGFADIVALFQHYSQPEALRHEIARTRGDLRNRNLMGELARQFGDAIGNHGALRDYIGTYNEETKQWERRQPDPSDYPLATEPHELGGVLVAALYDAFLSIYEKRTADLFRIATEGRGVLPEGHIHPDMVNRLVAEASDTAAHFLQIAIRALDYCPPVDITFAEYLRALVTSDADMTGDEEPDYRIAVIEAFRRRGIYSRDVRVLGEGMLRWQAPVDEMPDFAGWIRILKMEELPKNRFVGRLKDWPEFGCHPTLEWVTNAPRHYIDLWNDHYRMQTWLWMYDRRNPPASPKESRARFAPALGLELSAEAPGSIYRSSKVYKNESQRLPTLEVHSVRVARRYKRQGLTNTDVIIEMTQRRRGYLDPEKQKTVDANKDTEFLDPHAAHWQGEFRPDFTFRGGCTLLIDGESGKVRYCIKKDILTDLEREVLLRPRGSRKGAASEDLTSGSRLARQREFAREYFTPTLRATYDPQAPSSMIREPFAMLHRTY